MERLSGRKKKDTRKRDEQLGEKEARLEKRISEDLETAVERPGIGRGDKLR